MSKKCLDMVLGYTSKLYKDYGGKDNPNQFSIQVLRMMPRPFINSTLILFLILSSKPSPQQMSP